MVILSTALVICSIGLCQASNELTLDQMLAAKGDFCAKFIGETEDMLGFGSRWAHGHRSNIACNRIAYGHNYVPGRSTFEIPQNYTFKILGKRTYKRYTSVLDRVVKENFLAIKTLTTATHVMIDQKKVPAFWHVYIHESEYTKPGFMAKWEIDPEAFLAQPKKYTNPLRARETVIEIPLARKPKTVETRGTLGYFGIKPIFDSTNKPQDNTAIKQRSVKDILGEHDIPYKAEKYDAKLPIRKLEEVMTTFFGNEEEEKIDNFEAQDKSPEQTRKPVMNIGATNIMSNTPSTESESDKVLVLDPKNDTEPGTCTEETSRGSSSSQPDTRTRSNAIHDNQICVGGTPITEL